MNMVGSANNTFQLNMKEKYLCVHLKSSRDYKLWLNYRRYYKEIIVNVIFKCSA